MTDTKYVCKFERVGRNHHVPDLTVTVPEGHLPEHLIADAVVVVARKHLSSAYFSVDVDLSAEGVGTGSLDYGRFGKFSIEVSS